MQYPIKKDILKGNVKYYSDVIALLKEAENYLKHYSWCEKIYNEWVFTNFGYVLCIFLFEIKNTQSSEDNVLWVIAGDFPPMYLDSFNCHTTKEVLENYVELTKAWVKNVECGNSLEGCYPLKAEKDKETVALLKTRIDSIETIIIPNMEELHFKLAFQ